MKTVFLLLCLMLAAVQIESSRHHNKHKQRNSGEITSESSAEIDDGDSWPHPPSVNNFPVPATFSDDVSDGEGGEEEPEEELEARRHRSRHRGRKH